MMKNGRFHLSRARALGVSVTGTAVAIAGVAAPLMLSQPAIGSAATARTLTVSTAKTGLGQILVNSGGRTLYLFEKDKSGKSDCTGQCATFWPPLIATGKPLAAAGVKASLLGTTKRSDGRMQVTYRKHPVYTFANDTKKGQTNGEGVNAFGALWYALSPAGATVLKPAPSGGGSSSGSGGY
jgi:predicted lipoprotein with Yx(FWY)xxD motif